ncbi:MAG: helix-turn-helix domain-containing protein [Desulfovibrio sp.]
MSTKPFDKEAAHAWQVVMNNIIKLRQDGHTLDQIGKRLGVSKAAVSRWLSGNSGGERNPFGDMVRYAKKLGITSQEMFGETPTKKDNFDIVIARELTENVRHSGLSTEQILSETGLLEEDLNQITQAKRPASPRELHSLCKAIGLNPTILLNKAGEEAGIRTSTQQTRKTA